MLIDCVFTIWASAVTFSKNSESFGLNFDRRVSHTNKWNTIRFGICRPTSVFLLFKYACFFQHNTCLSFWRFWITLSPTKWLVVLTEGGVVDETFGSTIFLVAVEQQPSWRDVWEILSSTLLRSWEVWDDLPKWQVNPSILDEPHFSK